MDRNLRLRLVVRRNGLPETRILFNTPLAHDPTIANLVELVNETVPLETEEWGLEDYAVELHDKDGNAFECLHFQPVASVLDKDDEVFIRPLLTNDLKKRRLSGRIQIAHGGQHLLDGVPYGRPRLRAPKGRPAVYIAPRKRRRLTYDAAYYDQDDLEDEGPDDSLEAVERYIDARGGQRDDDGEDHQRLLTQNGEPASRNTSRRVRFPRNLTADALGQQHDGEADTTTGPPDDGEDEHEEDTSESEPEDDEQDDIEEELRGLYEEAAANEPAGGDSRNRGRFRRPDGDVGEPIGSSSASGGQVHDAGLFSDVDKWQESPVQHGSQSMGAGARLDLKLLDKITAIRSAFPAVSTVKCEELLIKHNRDVSSVWKKLARQVKPRLDLAHTMVLNTQLELPNEIQVMSSPLRKPAEVPGEVSRIEEDEDAVSNNSSSSEDEDQEHAEEQGSSSEGEESEESDNDSDNGSSSSGSEPSESESESESPYSSNGQTRKQQREQEQDSDNSSDDASGSEARFQQRISRHRRRNIVNSSPQSSQATTGKTGTVQETSRTPNKAVSDSSDAHSSSSEESDESSGEDDKASSSSSSSSSSSDSDSDTDSSSESDSDSDTRTSAPSKTKKTPVLSRTASTQRESSNALTASASQATVPPGQGLTRTQRRNARRRLQKQRQAASSDGAVPAVTENTRASSVDLAIKKAALLRSIGTPNPPEGQFARPATGSDGPLAAQDIVTSHMETDEAPEAWRHKISYRAVECINEEVELSEPPFPFVQRWDPQQRQRRGKRKSRNDTQFYDGPDQHSAKKRKSGPLRELVDDYQEDTTMLMMNQEDITLNYDDASPRAEEGSMTRSAEENDDLPSLPADLSSVPALRLEDLRPGVVIAWKQLLMSKATNWQPTLSGYITAVVVEVESNGDILRVQLAKRDRNVDRAEKEYDEEGERIYGKFEVPDDDDDDDDAEELPDGEDTEGDQGFRDLSFSEMMDPRIVLIPTQPEIGEKTTRSSEFGIEVADSQPDHKGEAKRGDNNKDSHEKVPGSHDVVGESFVSETNHFYTGDADEEVEDHAPLINSGSQISVSEQRREEISQLINEGGFRQEVRSSIDQSAFLHLGSPSRQLEEEASSILFSRQVDSAQRASSEEAPSEEAPSEYGSKDPSQQQDTHLLASEPTGDIFHSAQQSHGQARHEDASDQPNSTGGVEYPGLGVSFTSQASARSGRQLDPNFVAHSDDLGIDPPDDSVLMNGYDDDDVLMGDSNGPDTSPGSNSQGDREETPSQQIYNDDLHGATNTKAAITPLKSTQIGPEDDGAPGSGSSNSTRASSIFLDLELLGSQPARLKFPEQVKKEPVSSQVKVKGEPLSQPAQRMSQLPNIDEAMSPAAASSRISEVGGESFVNGRSTPNGRPTSFITSFDVSVSPPMRSRPRQHKALAFSAASSQESRKSSTAASQSSAPGGSRAGVDGVAGHQSGLDGPAKAGSLEEDDVSFTEPEPIYTEMYADDDVDGDYADSVPSMRKSTRRLASSRAERGASVPLADLDVNDEQSWVPSTYHGSGGRASGKTGERLSTPTF